MRERRVKERGRERGVREREGEGMKKWTEERKREGKKGGSREQERIREERRHRRIGKKEARL